MKSVSSSLNPSAASYIPLSKRGADHAIISFEKERTLKDSKSSEVPFSEAPFGSYATVASGSTSGHATNLRDKQTLDEEFQMNLEFLQMTYPELSYHSLAAVYQENQEDMEATVEMLNQLESYLDESLENLPETLDIGDVTGNSRDSKLKNAEGEEAASSSGNPITTF
ncbi:hypothetical protein MLD38_006014 [Melastoma candidum]|uniref:Uncharacterized protein n=1 Tax=Melastoma candidum TaxID=119954 RepID=A0ACB9RM48_9MYRT|nr:hypothetical protein MLD38_006014 [Melastoma candidum]